MTTIFVSHVKDDAECAEHIRQDLEAKGYTAWREPALPDLSSILNPRTIENVILGSAAMILVWSTSSAQSEWVERHILFAQRLKKPIFPVMLDGTNLPITLIVDTTFISQAACIDAGASLITHPDFPLSQSTDQLIVLSEKAAHEFIRIRKEAIDQAAEMLKRNEHREAVLAILEYLARHDLMMGVRDKAQEVLQVDSNQAQPPPVLRPRDSRHMFPMRCQKCGYITYFDKRVVCSLKEDRWREVQKSAELDVLRLQCGNKECYEEAFLPVDCEGYK